MKTYLRLITVFMTTTVVFSVLHDGELRNRDFLNKSTKLAFLEDHKSLSRKSGGAGSDDWARSINYESVRPEVFGLWNSFKKLVRGSDEDYYRNLQYKRDHGWKTGKGITLAELALLKKWEKKEEEKKKKEKEKKKKEDEKKQKEEEKKQKEKLEKLEKEKLEKEVKERTESVRPEVFGLWDSFKKLVRGSDEDYYRNLRDKKDHGWKTGEGITLAELVLLKKWEKKEEEKKKKEKKEFLENDENEAISYSDGLLRRQYRTFAGVEPVEDEPDVDIEETFKFNSGDVLDEDTDLQPEDGENKEIFTLEESQERIDKYIEKYERLRRRNDDN